MPSHRTEEVRRQIEDVISPYIGDRMARTSTELHCRKLGFSAEALSDDEVEALVDRLAKAMRVLVGSDTTEEVVEQIRERVGLAQGTLLR